MRLTSLPPDLTASPDGTAHPDGTAGAAPYDLCVAGAGPVGLALALEAAATGQRVLLLDAGSETSGRRDKPVAQRRADRVLDPEHHAPELQTTRLGVGGTSWMWGGRCVQFEEVDFSHREHVPASDWPIGFADLAPYSEQAERYMDCGTGPFVSTEPDWPGLGDLHMSQTERWARQPKLGPRLGAEVIAHPRIDLLCEAPVIEVAFDEAGERVDGFRILYRGHPATIRAARYALACGGMETTRLLLAAQRTLPDAFGGVDGPLGRYYMGHASGSIANIVLNDPADYEVLDFHRDEHDSYVRRRFSLGGPALTAQGLFNTSYHLDNPPFYDPTHLNATLSAVFLALSFAPVGRHILAEGIRLRHIGPAPRRYWPHIRNVLRRPWQAVSDTFEILRHRYLSKVRKPGFVLRNDGGTYALHYHAEQASNPDSRVTLNGHDNADGTPALDIDFRYADGDIDSILRSHEALDQRLRASGRARLEYLEPAEQRAAAVLGQAIDGFHHIGTTRMSADPRDGVVDADCRVHGIDNLYVASSSVLRTSGEANPTFTTVCLALRLAHHLAPVNAGAAEPPAVVPLPQSRLHRRAGASRVAAASAPTER